MRVLPKHRRKSAGFAALCESLGHEQKKPYGRASSVASGGATELENLYAPSTYSLEEAQSDLFMLRGLQSWGDSHSLTARAGTQRAHLYEVHEKI
jgi:hypothetical protein